MAGSEVKKMELSEKSNIGLTLFSLLVVIIGIVTSIVSADIQVATLTSIWVVILILAGNRLR